MQLTLASYVFISRLMVKELTLLFNVLAYRIKFSHVTLRYLHFVSFRSTKTLDAKNFRNCRILSCSFWDFTAHHFASSITSVFSTTSKRFASNKSFLPSQQKSSIGGADARAGRITFKQPVKGRQFCFSRDQFLQILEIMGAL